MHRAQSRGVELRRGRATETVTQLGQANIRDLSLGADILALASHIFTLDGAAGAQRIRQFKITGRISGYKGVNSA